MSKKVLDFSLSFFLVACGLGIMVTLLWGQSAVRQYMVLIEAQKQSQAQMLDSVNEVKDAFLKVTDLYLSAAEDQSQNQKHLMESAERINEVLFEAGLAFGVRALEGDDVIPPEEADKMVKDSIAVIKKHSEKIGSIAQYINQKMVEEMRK